MKRRFLARTEQYLSYGHDRLAAARLVAEAAGEPAGPVLDVGTGKGVLAMALAGMGWEVVTVDNSAEDHPLVSGLARECGLAPRICLTRADAGKLPFPDGHFAACAAMDALHHLRDGAAVLSEMVRVLRPGGTLVVAEFDGDGLDLVDRVHALEGLRHAVGPVTFAWADGFLSGAGLSRVSGRREEMHDLAVFRKPGVAAPGAPGSGTAFSEMSKEELLRALEAAAKNWLAHDGCWFLAAEDRYGTEAAIELDGRSWARFSVAEATRIMEVFGIPRGGGLIALAKVLERRQYALINRQRTEWASDGKALRFHMESCRVQEGRRRKNLPDFPCKPVGTIEFSGLAKTVDPRIRVRCVACPPDPGREGGCSWEFTVDEVRED